jgi:putative hemolysin
LQVRLEFAGQPREAIPASGPLIVVANHPAGLIDGMVLEVLLRSVRQDVTVMAIHLFAAIPEFRERYIFVGRPRSRSRRKLSVRGWRESYGWLSRSGALVVFPAGRVSRFQWRRFAIADGPWSSHIAAFARRSGAPVLPVYLVDRSSVADALVGIVAPLLRNIRSVAAVSSHRGKTVRAIVGRLIQPHELADFASDDAAAAFLRRETERLAR